MGVHNVTQAKNEATKERKTEVGFLRKNSKGDVTIII